MPENDFEKEVQKRLEELRLAPSEPVWQKIETAIQKKRKRRIVLWLLPLLLLTGGGIALWQTTRQQTIGAQEVTAVQKATQTFSNPHAPQNQHAPADRSAEEPSAPQAQTQRSHSQAAAKPAIISKRKSEPAKIAFAPVGKNAPVSVANEKQLEQTFSDAHAEGPVSPKTEFMSVLHLSPLPEIRQGIRVPDSIQKAAAAFGQLLKLDAVPIRDVVARKKWGWGVNGGAGISNIFEKPFSGYGIASNSLTNSFSEASADMPCLSCATLQMNRPGQWDLNRRFSQRSAVASPGLQASIGGHVKRAIGKNSFAAAGLQYSFYSNQLAVGSALYASSFNASGANVRYAYRNTGSRQQFTNTLHFIELPLSFAYRLLKSKPLRARHGVAAGGLVGSRVLQYDVVTDVYYSNNTGIRKINLSAFTALEYTLWKKAGYALQAGPVVQYGLLNSFKQASDKGHLVSGGIAVSMDF